MAIVANKRSIMTLYSDPMDIYCHCVRIVLAEKGVNVEIIEVNAEDKPEDLIQLNPYNTLPTLVDRDLVIIDARIIMEYLDERFPHPPLMPVYPVSRAENRQIMYRIDRDLYSLVNTIENSPESATSEKAKKQLYESLLSMATLFGRKPFFMNDDFSLVDCTLAALLWRFPAWGLDITKQSKAIKKYMDNVFSRTAFQTSLSDAERELIESVAA